MTTRDTERTRLPPIEPPPNSGTKPSPASPNHTRTTVPTPSDSSTATASRAGLTPPPPRARSLTIPPPSLDELEEGYSQRPPGSFLPERAIDEQLNELEAWAAETLRVERRETARFWLLRGLAFLSGVAAAAGGAVRFPTVALGGGVLAALAVAIDAAWPTTTDRVSRRRAIHDLRELQHTLKLKWDKVRLAYPDPNMTKRVVHALALLDGIQAKREDIGKYLGDAAPRVTRLVVR